MHKKKSTQVKMIDIYGGSITFGHGPAHGFDFVSLLKKWNPGWIINNKAIPATGVKIHQLCDIDYANVIVSEFRLNEHDVDSLKKWYKLLQKKSDQVVILELWSWTVPPKLEDSISIQSLPFVNNFKIIDLSKKDYQKWMQQKFPYTTRNMYDYRSIPAKCYDFISGINSENEIVFSNCVKEHANEMTHGTNSYHHHVAFELNKTLHTIPSAMLRNREQNTMHRRNHLCFGSWGLNGNQISFSGIETLLVKNNGFTLGCATHNKEKVSLYSNKIGSNIVLKCSNEYKNIIVGYVGHSDTKESVLFSLSDSYKIEYLRSNLSNLSVVDTKMRLETFSSKFKNGITITLINSTINTNLEITRIICIKK